MPPTSSLLLLQAAALNADDPRLCMELRGRLTAMGLPPDGLTYTMAIQAHAALGQTGEALAAFRQLSSDRSAQVCACVWWGGV